MGQFSSERRVEVAANEDYQNVSAYGQGVEGEKGGDLKYVLIDLRVLDIWYTIYMIIITSCMEIKISFRMIVYTLFIRVFN